MQTAQSIFINVKSNQPWHLSRLSSSRIHNVFHGPSRTISSSSNGWYYLRGLGRIRVAYISRRDVSNLHTALKPTPYQANRVLALLRKMFTFAISDNEREWGIAQNPASGVQRFQEQKRERWLSDKELERLTVALAAYPDKRAALADVSEQQRVFVRKEAQRAVDAIRLITVTGARKGEVLLATCYGADRGCGHPLVLPVCRFLPKDISNRSGAR